MVAPKNLNLIAFLFNNDWFLVCFVLALSLGAAYYARSSKRAARYLQRLDRREHLRLVATGAFVCALYFSAVALMKYYALNSHFDLSLFDQIVRNTWEGKLAWSGLKKECFFSEHFVPFFVIISPLSVLTPGPEYLLVLQAFLLALPAIFVYLIADEVLDSRLAGLCLGLVYLFYYLNHGANLCEFHQETALACCLLGAYCYLLRGRTYLYWALLLLALCLKEDISLYVIPFGLLVVAGGRKKTGAVTIGVAAAWLVLCLWVIIPHYYGQVEYPAMTRYHWLGETFAGKLGTIFFHPGRVLAHLARYPDWSAVAKLLVPLGLMCFFSVWGWLLPAAPLAANLLSTYPLQYGLAYHYNITVVPFLFLGAIYGGRRIGQLLQRRERRGWRRPLWVFVLVAGVLGSFTFGSYNYNMRKCRIGTHQRLFYQRLRPLLADGATVSAQVNLLASLSGREISLFPELRGADYILLDSSSDRWPLEREEYDQAIEKMRRGVEYGLVFDEDGYLLFKRP